MTEIVIDAVLPVIGIAAFAFFFYGLRDHARSKLQREFESHEFDTPAGRLRGADLQVVRFRFEMSYGGENASDLRTGWWYCVGPGPCWLLVIAQDEPVLLHRAETKWVLRDLGEQRMRGALVGDEAALQAALQAAFGDRPAPR